MCNPHDKPKRFGTIGRYKTYMEKKIEVKCEFEGYQPTLHPRSTVKQFAAHPNHPSASDSRGVSVADDPARVTVEFLSGRKVLHR
jgi:hypothetical protein